MEKINKILFFIFILLNCISVSTQTDKILEINYHIFYNAFIVPGKVLVSSTPSFRFNHNTDYTSLEKICFPNETLDKLEYKGKEVIPFINAPKKEGNKIITDLTFSDGNNITIKNFPIYLVNQSEFLSFNGEIGIGINSIKNKDSFLYTLLNQGLISKLTYYIIPKKGSFSFGGIDPTYLKDYKYKETLKMEHDPNDPESINKIQIKFDNAIYGNKLKYSDLCLYNEREIYINFDTSSNDLIVSEIFFRGMHLFFLNKYIKKGMCNSIRLGKFECNCKYIHNFPSIKFMVGNKIIEIDYKHYFSPRHQDKCILNIIGPNGNKKWTFGTPFISQFVSNFDLENKTVTFYSETPFKIYEDKKIKLAFIAVNVMLIASIFGLVMINRSKRQLISSKDKVSRLNDNIC